MPFYYLFCIFYEEYGVAGVGGHHCVLWSRRCIRNILSCFTRLLPTHREWCGSALLTWYFHLPHKSLPASVWYFDDSPWTQQHLRDSTCVNNAFLGVMFVLSTYWFLSDLKRKSESKRCRYADLPLFLEPGVSGTTKKNFFTFGTNIQLVSGWTHSVLRVTVTSHAVCLILSHRKSVWAAARQTL